MPGAKDKHSKITTRANSKDGANRFNVEIPYSKKLELVAEIRFGTTPLKDVATREKIQVATLRTWCDRYDTEIGNVNTHDLIISRDTHQRFKMMLGRMVEIANEKYPLALERILENYDPKTGQLQTRGLIDSLKSFVGLVQQMKIGDPRDVQDNRPVNAEVSETKEITSVDEDAKEDQADWQDELD